MLLLDSYFTPSSNPQEQKITKPSNPRLWYQGPCPDSVSIYPSSFEDEAGRCWLLTYRVAFSTSSFPPLRLQSQIFNSSLYELTSAILATVIRGTSINEYRRIFLKFMFGFLQQKDFQLRVRCEVLDRGNVEKLYEVYCDSTCRGKDE